MQKFIDTYDFKGKKVIARVDFNVPLDKDFKVTDDTRIRAAVPTIKKVLEGGGSIILMSHLGRPKGVDKKYSLEHIIYKVEELLGQKIQFCPDCMKADQAAKNLKPGDVLLLENLRFYAEEEGKPRGLADDASDEEKKEAKAKVKESQKEFTKHLASYADCYINDAFGTAHRAHASTALIAKYFPEDKMFGYIMEGEFAGQCWEPGNQDELVFGLMNDYDKDFLGHYGYSKFGDFVNPPIELAPYGEAWQIDYTPVDVEHQDFLDIQDKYLPELIMCEPDEFDALWDEFVEEITPSATVFGEFMWDAVKAEAAKVLENE